MRYSYRTRTNTVRGLRHRPQPARQPASPGSNAWSKQLAGLFQAAAVLAWRQAQQQQSRGGACAAARGCVGSDASRGSPPPQRNPLSSKPIAVPARPPFALYTKRHSTWLRKIFAPWRSSCSASGPMRRSRCGTLTCRRQLRIPPPPGPVVAAANLEDLPLLRRSSIGFFGSVWGFKRPQNQLSFRPEGERPLVTQRQPWRPGQPWQPLPSSNLLQLRAWRSKGTQLPFETPAAQRLPQLTSPPSSLSPCCAICVASQLWKALRSPGVTGPPHCQTGRGSVIMLVRAEST